MKQFAKKHKGELDAFAVLIVLMYAVAGSMLMIKYAWDMPWPTALKIAECIIPGVLGLLFLIGTIIIVFNFSQFVDVCNKEL